MGRSIRRQPFVFPCAGRGQRIARRIANRSMRSHDRLSLAAHGEDALFMLPHAAMNPNWTPQDGDRVYRSWEHYAHETRHLWKEEPDYRRWYRWVRAK